MGRGELGDPGDVEVVDVHSGLTGLGPGHHLAVLAIGLAGQALQPGRVVGVRVVPVVDQTLSLAADTVVGATEDDQFAGLHGGPG
jgi:hypothetical protein